MPMISAPNRHSRFQRRTQGHPPDVGFAALVELKRSRPPFKPRIDVKMNQEYSKVCASSAVIC
jgi:hypothetical protein